jgi:hypothetical protein
MKVAVVSWTNAVKGILQGKYALDDFDDAHFYFGCSRSHVLCDDQVPYESTWENKELPRHSTSQRCCLDKVDPANQIIVLFLLNVVRKAEEEGRVTWKIHPGVAIAGLPGKTEVLYNLGRYPAFYDHDARASA